MSMKLDNSFYYIKLLGTKADTIRLQATVVLMHSAVCVHGFGNKQKNVCKCYLTRVAE